VGGGLCFLELQGYLKAEAKEGRAEVLKMADK